MANERTENVGAGQTGVFVRLVLCCSVSCCSCFDHCAADMGLGVCVWYVPGHRLIIIIIIIIIILVPFSFFSGMCRFKPWHCVLGY